MKNTIYLILLAFLISNCGNEIKNKDAKVEEEQGTEISATDQQQKIQQEIPEETSQFNTENILGFWVGNFVPDNDEEDKTLYVDDGYLWDRTNKITISIDKITDSLVFGHSVVAGNDRPFEGTIKQIDSHQYSFNVKEPGDNKYDGEFSFTFFEDKNKLEGKWTAYKNIDIKKRKYSLSPKKFTYNPDIMLENSKRYMNWNKNIEKKEKFEYNDNEVDEWIAKEFATATHLSYQINASNKLLTKAEVENLKKGDLTIIRNSIYARHGYSFKNRPLRVFFDAQTWYIPVHSNIKNDFTEIEKQNIKLLLKYEKNAAEYYDSFGRG